MQGEALLKIGGILEKLSNDITILKNNSIEISGGNTIRNSRDCNSNPSNSRAPNRLPKPRSRSKSNKMKKKPILRSTSQKRRMPTKGVSLKKKQVKRNSKPKSSTKKNNKKR
jgi:hypothetical protein